MIVHDPIATLLGEWSEDFTVGSVFFRIGITLLFAFLIGWERSSKRHSAGLRTFILVALASAIAMMIDLYLHRDGTAFIPLLSAAAVIATAMISGNSILFSSRSQIKGLTTSAGLWTCSVIGLSAGGGMYTVTLVAFAVLLFILAGLPPIETYFKNRSNHFEVHLELKDKAYLQDFVTVLRRLGVRIDDIESNSAYVGSGLSVYSVTVTICSKELKKYKTHSEIIEALRSLEYIYHIEEI